MTTSPNMSPPIRRCVYTTMIGDYESLNEQPVAAESGIPFICFTDSPELTSDTWTIRHVSPALARDPVRSQRILKIAGHRVLPDVDTSLYIDNSVILEATPEEIFDRYPLTAPLALMPHSFRRDVLAEALEVLRVGYDDAGTVCRQVQDYGAISPSSLGQRPYWTGFMLRSHSSALARQLADEWLANVLRYSRRDQLSLNVALDATGVRPVLINEDNHRSWCHSWPHVRGRRTRPVGATGVQRHDGTPPDTRARLAALTMKWTEAEELLAASRREAAGLRDRVVALSDSLREMEGSRSWTLTRPLRELRARLRRSTHTGPHVHADAHEPAVQSVATADGNSVLRIRTPSGTTIYADAADGRGQALKDAAGALNWPTLRMWEILMKAGDWTDVIDIGANYGEMLVNVDLPPSARITAVEPNPRAAHLLRRTLRANGVRATVHQVAVAPTRGRTTLAVDPEWSGLSRLAATAASPTDGHAVQVEAVTIDSLLGPGERSARNVLMKIDIEGDEVSALRSALSGLKALAKVVILAEVLHASPDDLQWLCSNFRIAGYLLPADDLVPLDTASGAILQERLSTPGLYPQDVVLTPRD